MQCSTCGEEMEYDIVEIELVARETLAQPGWYCWTCNLSGHSAQDLFHADRVPDYPPGHARDHAPEPARPERMLSGHTRRCSGMTRPSRNGTSHTSRTRRTGANPAAR